jgi:hypothetical protein
VVIGVDERKVGKGDNERKMVPEVPYSDYQRLASIVRGGKDKDRAGKASLSIGCTKATGAAILAGGTLRTRLEKYNRLKCQKCKLWGGRFKYLSEGKGTPVVGQNNRGFGSINSNIIRKYYSIEICGR